jgi:hypothetical protein
MCDGSMGSSSAQLDALLDGWKSVFTAPVGEPQCRVYQSGLTSESLRSLYPWRFLLAVPNHSKGHPFSALISISAIIRAPLDAISQWVAILGFKNQ